MNRKESTIKILGYTTDHNVCGICGKQELKGTVAYTDESGEIYYAGTTCIQHVYKLSFKEIEKEIKTAEIERQKAIKKAIFLSYESRAFEAKLQARSAYIENYDKEARAFFEKTNDAELTKEKYPPLSFEWRMNFIRTESEALDKKIDEINKRYQAI